ncbi:MAG TPA: GTP-binding protein [Bradyrhizobium sp.]|uniref:CobW family GTP-binding protein n=1 Tax=Bradyrhizobium sp. TaxID=376 RepID=UPI002D7E6447|nr:GTP-binding protein [Bradyrhizobium sp.]HET7888542.1 GTP-binding protein [Bradyrhizobium sp.]
MNRIPLVLLTGFLGAGKTTMLNALLARPDFRDTAVVINEAGDVGLDHLLVEQGSDSITMLEGGCLCCRAKGALAPALANLMRRARQQDLPPFKRVVVETSGLSDPAPLLEGLIADALFNRFFELAGVVAAIDVRTFMGAADQHPEARMQAALADRLLLTKTDIATSGETRRVQEKLTLLNPHARQCLVQPGTVTMPAFWPEILDLPRALAKPHLICSPEPAAIATASLIFDGAIEPDALEDWLDHTINLLGPTLLRMKAMLNVADTAQPTVLHAVQGLLHRPVDLKAWPDEARRNRVVLIGRDVEEQILADALARLAATGRRRTAMRKVSYQ